MCVCVCITGLLLWVEEIGGGSSVLNSVDQIGVSLSLNDIIRRKLDLVANRKVLLLAVPQE